ncbi:MAG TPA: L,D-transpeptidase family protein [Gaiellaceae bacterium]|nr:L,D-transpeptidase family protein [Gaiellaceae bacterium]
MPRRLLLLPLAGLVLAGPAHAATLTLHVEPAVARYGAAATFTGALVPAQAGVPVGLYVQRGSSAELVASTATAPDGSFRLATAARAAGTFVAVAQVDPATQAASAPAALRMRPLLSARVLGRRVVGHDLALAGRLLPAVAGRLTLRVAGERKPVRVNRDGRFRVLLPSVLPGRAGWRLALAPAAGYEAVRRSRALVVRAPRLGLGSAGGAVRALEDRLRDLHYVLRGVDAHYGSDTYEAVMAFQKVHGLARTGRVESSLWRRLAHARTPRAHVPSGTHIEISKTRQVMFEVVNGRVARVVHVSTGATGNTPVGRWRVYRLGPGYNALGMYYSLYFLRGFAIHGYRSVPPFPASHGCIRTPIWFAPGFYRRWGRLGTAVYIFP